VEVGAHVSQGVEPCTDEVVDEDYQRITGVNRAAILGDAAANPEGLAGDDGWDVGRGPLPVRGV